jgi:pilus assembly protein CpaB
MSRRFLLGILLAFSVGSGILALHFLRQSEKETAAAMRTIPTQRLYVFARDLPAGHVLTSSDVSTVDWPAESQPEGGLSAVDSTLGGVLLDKVAKGDLVRDRLVSRGALPGFSGVIPRGYRAVSVEVDEVSGVSGFVSPGQRVDVLATYQRDEEFESRLVLANVILVAVAQDFQRPDAAPEPKVTEVVTLLVTPVEAERLALASSRGKIHLALRNVLDDATPPTPGATLSSFGSTSALVPSSPEPSGRVRSASPARRSSGHSVRVWADGSEPTVVNFR